MYCCLYFFFSKVRKLEKKYEVLEREVRYFKKKLWVFVVDVVLYIVFGLSSSFQVVFDGLSVEELLQCVLYLLSKDVGIIFCILVYKVFENEDFFNCLRIGKKIVNLRDNFKFLLNVIKLEIV